MIKEQSVGNIKFTEEGISIIIPYSAEVSVEGKRYTYEDIRPMLVAFCNKRMRKCAEKLGRNINSAKSVTKEVVVWLNGHFSLPIYNMLKDFVESNGDIEMFDPIILQQVIREFNEGTCIYEEHLDANVYQYYRKNNNISSESFFRVITDMLIGCMDYDRLSQIVKGADF